MEEEVIVCIKKEQVEKVCVKFFKFVSLVVVEIFKGIDFEKFIWKFFVVIIIVMIFISFLVVSNGGDLFGIFFCIFLDCGYYYFNLIIVIIYNIVVNEVFVLVGFKVLFMVQLFRVELDRIIVMYIMFGSLR